MAIKVFKTTLNEFKTRDKYIRDDYRFRDRFGKQNPRKIIHMWAEKELHNLMKMFKNGVRVPEAVLLKKHVLVMSFIGREGRPAPKLKDAQLSTADWELAYADTVQTMKTLYIDCHLVRMLLHISARAPAYFCTQSILFRCTLIYRNTTFCGMTMNVGI